MIAQLRQSTQVRGEIADLLLSLEQEHLVTVGAAPDLHRLRPEQSDRFRPRPGMGRDGRKSQFQRVARQAPNFEDAGLPRSKGHAVAAVPLQEHVSARQCRMAAQADFTCRRKPAQLPFGAVRWLRHEEGGFGKHVLGRYGLEHWVRQPFAKHHDRGLIAGERSVGEGIDMPIGQRGRIHVSFSSLANSSASTSLLPGSSTWPSGSMWISSSMSGKARVRSRSTRSMMAWASATVIAGGRSTWNWTKSRLPLVRVRKS